MKILTFPGLWLMLAILTSCHPSGESASTLSDLKGDEDSVSFFTPQRIDSLLRFGLDSVIQSHGSPLLAAHILGKSVEDGLYMVVIRSGPGQVEIHKEWDDVVIIRSGHGILNRGYQVDGEKKESSPGNWVGGTIVGGEKQDLSPGDFLIIPAMEGHQYIPQSGDSLTYWTIKVKRPARK